MKKFSASVCAVAAAALLTGSLSFAEGRDHSNEDQRSQRHGPRQDQRWDERHFDAREGRWNDRRPDYNARGPEFHRGGYIPPEYRMRAYEVDYRNYHLRRPPYGHRWVQVGADYVLIAIATGVIADIILNH